MTHRFSSLVCSLFLLIGVQLSRAQAVANAQITGEVIDQSGAAVAGATVTMTETERGVSHTAKSDSAGRYTVTNLPVGPIVWRLR